MADSSSLQATIDSAFEQRAALGPASAPASLRAALDEALGLLDSGTARVAEKQAAAGSSTSGSRERCCSTFACTKARSSMPVTPVFTTSCRLKFAAHDEATFRASGIRVVPHAIVRKGAFIAPSVVLMPSYVNVGAYVDNGTMVDTWATVGSCAQIGRNVHLSGGVGIGGVLEPVQAAPTIIEDNCFIGARSEIVEGVIVGEGAVISMGVFIGQSTRIFDRATGTVSLR